MNRPTGALEWTASNGAATAPADWTGRQVRIRLRDLMRAPTASAMGIEAPPPGMAADEVVLEGRFLNLQLQPGLHLHVSEMIERHMAPTRMLQEPGLYCVFLLRGVLDLSYGGRALRVGGAPAGRARGLAVLHEAPQIFERRPCKPQRIDKVILSAAPDWLEREGAELLRARPAAVREGLRVWEASPRLVETLGQLLRPQPLLPSLNRLYFESRAIEAMAEALAALWRADPVEARGLSARERRRLEAVKAHIRSRAAEPLTLTFLAREAGMSATALQRLFQIGEGRSVFAHVREMRLEEAYEALRRGASVAEAASAAGYGSAANFATAFRRRYGLAPGKARG